MSLKEKILLDMVLPAGDMLIKTHTHRYYHLIRRMNGWSRAEVRHWQEERLQELIRHHHTHTPYYHDLFGRLGLEPGDIRTLDDLQKIPPVTKEEIYANFDALTPVNLASIRYKKAVTGGSVSTLKYYLDLKSWSFSTAMKIYSWKTCGYRYGDSFANLGGTSLFSVNTRSWKHSLYYRLKSSIQLSAMNMSEEVVISYIDIIRKHRAKYIYGYAAAIYLLARYINANNIKLNSVKGCFATSEVLTEEYRSEIEKAFGYVMDCYGARDGGIHAYEIERGRYHVGYNAIAETVNEFEKDTGTLVVTDLLNYAFPFIRYEIGDDVELQKEPDSNYNGQVIRRVLGRTPDIIKLENGRVLAGVGFYVMFGRFNVSAYKIQKSGPLELRVQLQKKQDYDMEEEKHIIDTIKKHAGDDCSVKIEYTVFKEEKNSKRRFIMLD